MTFPIFAMKGTAGLKKKSVVITFSCTVLVPTEWALCWSEPPHCFTVALFIVHVIKTLTHVCWSFCTDGPPMPVIKKDWRIKVGGAAIRKALEKQTLDFALTGCPEETPMVSIILKYPQNTLHLCSVSLSVRRTDPALLLSLSSAPSVKHIICLLEAPVTLKKLISVSLNVYLEVHHILCNSHGTFQKSVCCPCQCTVTRLILLTTLIMTANLVSVLKQGKCPICSLVCSC